MQGYSRCDVFKTPLLFSLTLIVILVAGLSEALAYDKYSDCDDCHGDFVTVPIHRLQTAPIGATACMTFTAMRC